MAFFRLALTLLALLAGAPIVSAQALGTFGATYPIAEPDMLVMMERRARNFVESGDYDRWKTESIERATRTINEPPPVPLSSRPEHRHYQWDPTVEITKDVIGHDGEVMVAAGTAFNPLDVVSLSEQLLFFDGRDERQVEWALRVAATAPSKLILTGGSWTALSRRIGRRVYYDVSGWMTTRLGITGVPAQARQNGRMLEIEEGIPCATVCGN